MSLNTYFAIPDRLGRPDCREVYKTTDPNRRSRLKRRGWIKVRRDELDRAVGRGTAAALAKEPDGRYLLREGGWAYLGAARDDEEKIR